MSQRSFAMAAVERPLYRRKRASQRRHASGGFRRPADFPCPARCKIAQHRLERPALQRLAEVCHDNRCYRHCSAPQCLGEFCGDNPRYHRNPSIHICRARTRWLAAGPSGLDSRSGVPPTADHKDNRTSSRSASRHNATLVCIPCSPMRRPSRGQQSDHPLAACDRPKPDRQDPLMRSQNR